MKSFFVPIIDLLFEAFEGGVDQEAIIKAIKAEMTALARVQVEKELEEKK